MLRKIRNLFSGRGISGFSLFNESHEHTVLLRCLGQKHHSLYTTFDVWVLLKTRNHKTTYLRYVTCRRAIRPEGRVVILHISIRRAY